MATDLDTLARARAQKWLDGEFDENTKRLVRDMMAGNPDELRESFHRDLEFGTGGLRGIMGVGTNRMNIYTVGMATQGLANYLTKCFEGEEIRVAVSHDSRNNSRTFAERVADIFASNGFKTYLFDSLRPTPELSFAIRELGCHSGVMVTASHNPREYNGYKAYWNDGSQVTEPHDANIIAEVGRITDISQIRTGDAGDRVVTLDGAFDDIYLNKVRSLSLAPDAVKRFHDMKIVYTPLHGAGVRLVPESLRRFGFTNVSMVPAQSILDGNFPTVEYPNPAQNNGFGSSAVQLGLPGVTPWRTLTVGENLKPIVETTIPFDVVEPLYEPSRKYKYGKSTWSWIVWQDQSMNWDDQVKYIDLAADLGYEYILIDALWDQNIGYDRMKELIRYANSKKVDVFLWYNSNGSFNDAPQTPKNKMNTAIARKKEMKWLKEAGVKGSSGS